MYTRASIADLLLSSVNMSSILLVLLFFQLRPCTGAVYEARSLVLFKAGKRWNEARNVCAQGNGYLATADKYTMSILLQTKNNGVISMWDNVWIGLHTADPVYNMLSAKGFVWEDCQMLGDWTNWQADQPSNRYNNWCVRLQFSDNLKWYPEQCTSQAHFLCQYNRGPCQEWRNTSDCVMTSANLLSIIKATQDEAVCRDECLNFQEQENKLCWGFSFSISASGCTIHIGENPVLCSENPSVTYSPGTSFTWIRQCFNVSSTTSIPIDVINQDSFPSNHCDSLTTQGPDTTSRLSQRTTVVTRTSGSPGTDVTLRESTGTSTLSTRDGTRTVTNIPTTERTQDVTNVPTTEGTQAVTNIPTTDGTQAVTNVPTTEGTQAVTNVPTRQGTQDVTNIPTREGTQDVTNVKTTEGTQGVTTTTIGAQTTTTLTTTVGGQWGQTSIATVLSTESKIPGKESPSFLCVCNFKQPSSISIKEQLDARQEEIKKLSLNKSSLSSWRRKRESAKDNRVSAQTAGLIGVVCLAAVAFLIVLFDIGSLWIKISDKTLSIASK